MNVRSIFLVAGYDEVKTMGSTSVKAFMVRTWGDDALLSRREGFDAWFTPRNNQIDNHSWI
jgi:hypothetical protein